MIAIAILLFAMSDTMAKPTVCTPAGVKKPSLMSTDSKGKCQEGYMPMKDKDGKKVMYCVNTVKPTKATCKESSAPPMAKQTK